VTALFPRVAAIVIFFFVVLIEIRGSAGAKGWDQAAFALSVLGAAFVTVRFLRRPTMMPSRIALIVSIAGLACGIARGERADLTAVYWEGFGTSVAIICVPVSLLLVPASAWLRRSRGVAFFLAGLASILAVADGTSLIRDVRDFAVTGNNTFVLNEVLAPSAGRVPGSNFVPQYTTLYGWVLVPFRHLVSATELANLGTLLLSALGIASVALAVFLGRRCFPSRSLWLALVLTVPLASLTVFHSPTSSSIGSELQELPVRMFPAMLCSVIAIPVLVALLQGSIRKTSLVALGVLSGLMAWNSQDVGLAVALTMGIVLQVVARGVLRRPASLLWVGGLIPALLLYPLCTWATGHSLKLGYFALTARSFRNGFGSAPIQIPGPVLLVLPVIIGSLAVGGSLLWRISGNPGTRPKFQLYAIVTLAFVGLWSTGSLPYYVNRSYASGQLQVFLLPFGVCCCALLSLCRTIVPEASGRLWADTRLYLKTGALWLLPVTLPIAVGFGALLQTPNPSTTLTALTHLPPSQDFLSTLEEVSSSDPGSPQLVTNEVAVVQAYARKHGGGSVGYFGPNANYVALATGAEPRILYDDPGDFGLSSVAQRLGCEFLRHHPTRWLVTAPNTTPILGPAICGDYESVTVANELPDTVFRLRA
jgi:hypothetical protein